MKCVKLFEIVSGDGSGHCRFLLKINVWFVSWEWFEKCLKEAKLKVIFNTGLTSKCLPITRSKFEYFTRLSHGSPLLKIFLFIQPTIKQIETHAVKIKANKTNNDFFNFDSFPFYTIPLFTLLIFTFEDKQWNKKIGKLCNFLNS